MPCSGLAFPLEMHSSYLRTRSDQCEEEDALHVPMLQSSRLDPHSSIDASNLREQACACAYEDGNFPVSTAPGRD